MILLITTFHTGLLNPLISYSGVEESSPRNSISGCALGCHRKEESAKVAHFSCACENLDRIQAHTIK